MNQETNEPAPAAAGEPASANPEHATAESAVVDATARIAAAQAEAAKMKDMHLRALADLDNIRRRTQRDIEDSRKFALQRFAEDLLPVLDDLASGLAAADNATDVKTVTDGFRMMADRLKGALAKNGVTELNPVGAAFDPHAHESVAHAPHDTVPEDHVARVYRAGYKLHDRVLRPASVVVSSGPAA